MITKTFIICILYLFSVISTEKQLTEYKIDKGRAPGWIPADRQANHIVLRWGVDESTGRCISFEYLGAGGNFNNFPTFKKCQDHLKFQPHEQVLACAENKNDGVCTVPLADRPTRWYFKKTAGTGGTPAAGTCNEFKYTGCGGNANNFETEEQYNVSGTVPTPAPTPLFKAPNDFDCGWMPEVDTATPIVGAVKHKTESKCVYAAVAENAKRGFFENIAECVHYCIPEEKQVEACKQTGPHQTVSSTDVTQDDEQNFKEYFYYDKIKKLCLSFNSKPPAENVISSRNHNIFESAEICASYCPAIKQHEPLIAENVCILPKKGTTTDGGKYKVPRWFFTPGAAGQVGSCASFDYSGIGGNLNNFKSQQACENLCKTPTGATPNQE